MNLNWGPSFVIISNYHQLEITVQVYNLDKLTKTCSARFTSHPNCDVIADSEMYDVACRVDWWF
jgi:hypothetical protein